VPQLNNVAQFAFGVSTNMITILANNGILKLAPIVKYNRFNKKIYDTRRV
jgi:hypothetical protein